LASYRSNSPSTKGMVQPKWQSYFTNNSLRKIQSHSNLHLLQNLSLEGRLAGGVPEVASLKVQTKQAFGSKTGEAQRFYSPRAVITINKALSRISSMNELKKIKEQMLQDRKSVQMAKKGQRKISCLNGSKKGTEGRIEIQQDDDDYLTDQEKLWNAISGG